MEKHRLCIIVPCYNEEKVLPITAELFLGKIKKLIEKDIITDSSRVMFVNDGSDDKTWQIIKDLAKSDVHFIGISQSRNMGHQNALLAGLMEANGKFDITVSIDCDGQDDIDAIDKMITEYKNGSDVVYGVRYDRKNDSFFKRFTAETFYKLLKAFGVDIVFNHADYRLMSRRAVNALADFKEVNLFIRGLIPLVGFRSSVVYYERKERMAGDSHYRFKKMLGLAFDGITGLSVKPIRLIFSVGLFFVILSALIGIVWAFLGKGYPLLPIVCLISFFGGLQLSAIGIIGEYIGKTYLETKARPRYIISEKTYNDF